MKAGVPQRFPNLNGDQLNYYINRKDELSFYFYVKGKKIPQVKDFSVMKMTK